MTTKLQTDYTRSRQRFIVGQGDSLLENITTGVRFDQFWTEQVGVMLRGLGCNVKAADDGISGTTTTNLLATAQGLFTRFQSLIGPPGGTQLPAQSVMLPNGWANSIPDVVFSHIGVNDPGASISQATTQSNLQGIVKIWKWRCKGTVANVAALPAGGAPGDRWVVLSDSDPTGGPLLSPGQTVLFPWQKPTITTASIGTANALQSVWEWRNSQSGNVGWARIALATTPNWDGVQRIIITSVPYLNFSNAFSDGSGRDNNDVVTGLSFVNGTSNDSANPAVPLTSYAPVYAAQQAAVVAEGGQKYLISTAFPAGFGGTGQGVALCDLYGFLSNCIRTGVTTQGNNAAWHVADGNQHPSATGSILWAQALVQTIQAAGWITALQQP